MKSNKRAFTLAEVLTTLMVIGIVAALTIPNLINNYKKRSYVIGLKKSYSQLSQAIKMIPISEGCPSGDFECVNAFQTEEGETYSRRFIKLLAKQLKVEHIDIDYCMENVGSTRYNCMTLTDGSSIGAYLNPKTKNSFLTSNIGVDVNGEAGPNVIGLDRFRFFVTQEDANGVPAGTVIPGGSKLYAQYKNNTAYWKNAAANNVVSCGPTMHYGCASRVLEEGAINYEIK